MYAYVPEEVSKHEKSIISKFTLSAGNFFTSNLCISLQSFDAMYKVIYKILQHTLSLG